MEIRRLPVAGIVILVAALMAIAVLTHPSSAMIGPFQRAHVAPVHIPGPCDGGAATPFTPTSIDIEHVRKGLPILPLGRTGDDVPGVPPVSATHTVAWDEPGPKPGSRSGLVRFNAHTWPNGAALGNEMLAKFEIGDVLTLHGGGHKLCYRVTKRVEVDGYATYDEFFAEGGPPQFAFIVCSGQRLGPGNWTKRTVWWGSPVKS